MHKLRLFLSALAVAVMLSIVAMALGTVRARAASPTEPVATPTGFTTRWTSGPVFNVACSNTINVADGDVVGLIAAINAANASGCSTTMNLAHNSIYTLTAVAEDDGYWGPTGLPYIRRQITINGNGATLQRSNASGTPSFAMLFIFVGNLTLDRVTVKGGSIGGLGMTSSTALITNSTITENVGSGGGGGISNNCSHLTIVNSTISHNTNSSAYGGGGILNFSSPPNCLATSTIVSSTIFENRNDNWGRGDGIADAFSTPGTILVKNSILASPTSGASNNCYASPGVFVSQGHNIGSDGTCGLTGPGDMQNTNPLLGPLADNGGPTPTHMPQCNSPAIDAVPVADSTDVNGVPITTDQRGGNRPAGAGSDIGAVEVSDVSNSTPPIVSCPSAVTASADSNCQARVPDVLVGVTASGGCGGSITLAQSPAADTLVGFGDTTVTVTATDAANNSSTCTTTFTVTDVTPPTITINTPSNGAAYLLNQSVAANYSCADCGGVASCLGPVVSGGRVDTAPVGTKTFTVSAIDDAGNHTTQSVNYTVSYGVRVLFDQSRAAKSGSTIPIKIQLVDANGSNVSSPSVVVHAMSVVQISSSASVLLDDAGQANPDFDFRYDSSMDGYIFNLKTTGYGTGSYLLNFSVGSDPVLHSVAFQVRQ